MEKITLDEHIKGLEKPVEVIAHVRRMAEISGVDMEEFDAKLNELCTEKHKMFAKMDEAEVAIYGLKVILEAGKGKELFEDLFRGE
jgi:hypothetical protein